MPALALSRLCLRQNLQRHGCYGRSSQRLPATSLSATTTTTTTVSFLTPLSQSPLPLPTCSPISVTRARQQQPSTLFPPQQLQLPRLHRLQPQLLLQQRQGPRLMSTGTVRSHSSSPPAPSSTESSHTKRRRVEEDETEGGKDNTTATSSTTAPTTTTTTTTSSTTAPPPPSSSSPSTMASSDQPPSTATFDPSNPTIELTPLEETIRSLLVDCATYIDNLKLTNPTLFPTSADAPSASSPTPHLLPPPGPTILRFTGGWVRDKLLRGQSHDIDVGITTLTGYDFGQHLREFITLHGPKYGISTGSRGIHKIESNPSKSKHLETATTRILGLDIDLVNMRSEAYSGDSRIPTEMVFGTPEEDARRRDATVNALFYNLHTRQVEDFTGLGLRDLKGGLIRTPTKPWTTFNDDPLRVLRLIRFASRLGFQVADDVKLAMRDAEVKRSLRCKISRERVGNEVEKMLRGPDPGYALRLIHELGLFGSIFGPPVEDMPELPEGYLVSGERFLEYLLNPANDVAGRFPHVAGLVGDAQERYLAWNMAAVMPWVHRTHVPPGQPGKSLPQAAVAAREGLKMNNRDFDILVAAFRNLEVVRGAVMRAGVAAAPGGEGEEEAQAVEKEKDREEVGLVIKLLGRTWRNQVLCALLVEVSEREGLEREGREAFGPGNLPDPEREEVLGLFDTWVGKVVGYGLEGVYDLKAVLNGKDLSKVLGRTSGPWMKAAVEKLFAWQLRNPAGTREEARAFVASPGFLPAEEVEVRGGGREK